MEKLRVLSLFSGIGAFEKALTNLGIPYELVNYCEINEHGWEVMGFNRDMTKIYIIESPMGKELDLYIKAIEPKYVMIKDLEKRFWSEEE